MSAAGDRVRGWITGVAVAPNQFGLPFNETRADALSDVARLEAVAEAARPYRDHAAPHEQLFNGQDLRNFEALDAALRALEE